LLPDPEDEVQAASETKDSKKQQHLAEDKKESLVRQLEENNIQLQPQLQQLLTTSSSLPTMKQLSCLTCDAEQQGHSPLIKVGQRQDTGFCMSFNGSNGGPAQQQMAEPDEHMLQLHNALVTALAELQRCSLQLSAKERDLKLLQEQGQPQVSS